MALPRAGVRNQHPALAVGVAYDEGTGARQRASACPRASVGREVPAQREAVVGSFGRHKPHTLAFQYVFLAWQHVYGGNQAAQLGCRGTPCTGSLQTRYVVFAVAFLYLSAAVVDFIYRRRSQVQVVFCLVRTQVAALLA